MIETRKPGRPRIHPTEPTHAAGPVVFLTREQLAERWHCKPDTITRIYRKMGLRKVPLNGRWLVSLEQVQEVERKKMAAAK